MPIHEQIGRFQFDPICKFRGKQEIVIPRCRIGPKWLCWPIETFSGLWRGGLLSWHLQRRHDSDESLSAGMQLLLLNVHRGSREFFGSLGASKHSEKLWGTPDIGEHFLSAYKSVIGNGQLDWMLWWPSHFHFSTDWMIMIKINLSLNHPQPTLLPCTTGWLPPQAQLKQQVKCMVCHGYNDTKLHPRHSMPCFPEDWESNFPTTVVSHGEMEMVGAMSGLWVGWSRYFGKIFWNTDLKSCIVMTYQPTCPGQGTWQLHLCMGNGGLWQG